MATCLVTFLEKIGLQKYTQRLASQGYENAFDICLLGEKDLDQLRVLDSTDRGKLLQAAAILDVEEWLKYLELECYLDSFRAEGINTVRDLKSIEFSDDLLDALEVMIPGHRKRLNWAASFLKWYSTPHQDTRLAVIGYWGQPPSLEDNQHPFLCVPGYLKSGTEKDAHSSELLQFIVDSGSDVVTATESLISELGLEYLRHIESRGVHSVATKPIYRGVLTLGTDQLEVEVMPEKFASVGNVVMRKFSHYINGTYHRWLKEDVEIEEFPS